MQEGTGGNLSDRLRSDFTSTEESGGFGEAGGMGASLNSDPQAKRITHPTPLGVKREEPISIAAPAVPSNEGDFRKKITAFGQQKRHEEEWDRTPNTNGTGAIHVRTFHAKLTEDALRYMDQTVNEWLDAHPQYEVKFVNSTIGQLTGKIKEPHLICQIWV